MHLDVNGKLGVGRLESLDRIDPRENGPFVVGGASAVELAVLFDELERLGGPAVGFLRRLHIEMAVDAERLFAVVRPEYAEQDGRQFELRSVG